MGKEQTNEQKPKVADAKHSHAYMRMRVRDLCSVLRPHNIDQRMMSVAVMKFWVVIFENALEMYNVWCKENGINQSTGIEYAVVRDYADTIADAKAMSMTAKEKAELIAKQKADEIAELKRRLSELENNEL